MASLANENIRQVVDVGRLGLGTVQWGVAYGISNQAGRTASDEVRAILSAAQAAGIRVLDTASLYGEAERTLGANRLEKFRVVTKTPRYATKFIGNEQVQDMFDTFERSLEKLAVDRVDGLLAHHAPDIMVEGGDLLIAGMERLKELGQVSKIGVSIYDADQLDSILRKFTPDLVQLPLNVFDQRLIHSGWLQRLCEKGVEVHVRSVFLQGLLLMPLEDIPTFFDPVRPLLSRWHAAASEQGLSLVQAALAFVRDLQEVDHLLIGVESLMQFESCLEDFLAPNTFDATGLACEQASFLNPALWDK